MSQNPAVFIGHYVRLAAISAALVLLGNAVQAAPPDLVALPGHLPAALAGCALTGQETSTAQVSLAIVLPLRNQDELSDQLQQLYDPTSVDYHRFLTTTEFTALYGPSESDYAAVAEFAQSRGLTITATHSNRLVLDVSGSTTAVERAFDVELTDHIDQTGRRFFAPDREPLVPAAIASRIQAVVGLDNAALFRPQIAFPTELGGSGLLTAHAGSGYGGSLYPSDIRSAYNLTNSKFTGAGQTLAVFELDGYTASDVANYESAFGLRSVPLQNILIDGASGTPSGNGGEMEVTLDIELEAAIAPSAAKILVYEAPNSGSGVIDDYNRIATDNLAKQISTSWGAPEITAGSAALNAEASIFKEMAAQGQSIYAAAADSGAYDNGTSLTVDDPASQPYVCGVGGTSLTTNSNHTYASESTWNDGTSGGAGGGGESVIWSKPSYQGGFGLSSSMRNVPDVALDADPNTGYAIYVDSNWYLFGGTSCAAPLWAAFTALVNQQRAVNGLGTLGFANPAIYSLAASADSAADFHDIADNSNNLYYTAVPGFDNATGWGSFNGANLLDDLSSASPPASNPTATPTHVAGAYAGSSTIHLTWTSGAAGSFNVLRAGAHGGPYLKIGSSTADTYADNTASGNGTYYYVVTATCAAGTSANSAEVAVATVAPPAAPVGLTAKGIVGREAALAWTASSGATDYIVYRGPRHGGPYTTVAITTATRFTDVLLRSSTSYFYVVAAANSGGVGNASAEAVVTTGPSVVLR